VENRAKEIMREVERRIGEAQAICQDCPVSGKCVGPCRGIAAIATLDDDDRPEAIQAIKTAMKDAKADMERQQAQARHALRLVI